MKSRAQLEKMTKTQLVDYIREQCVHIDDCYSDDQMKEKYDEGFDAGYYQGKEDSVPVPLDDEDLEEYPNVIRFG